MNYRVSVAPTGRRAISRLPEGVAAAVYEFLAGALADNPHRVGKRLSPPLGGLYAARRGTYRVIYRVDDVAAVVEVVNVEHRGKAYRS
ncbi:MAG: type II toxin-antitoxin system RelE/ParE family toxin [Actinomycetota bacterium]|nr:type II toxin-antitoxin system RelE/ParE family toxin [Actinomycetota bacterium]